MTPFQPCEAHNVDIGALTAACAVDDCTSQGVKGFKGFLSEENLHPFPALGECDYQGEVGDDGLSHGQGVMTWPRGHIRINESFQYRGQFSRGKAHGHGQYRHVCGSIYEGHWVDGEAEGYGEHTDSTFCTYHGQWSRNRQHGHGLEKWPNGYSYEGEYRHGKKHGAGLFSYAEAEFYQGEFANDVFDGYGSYYWQDGRCFTGNWIHGNMDGHGLYMWPEKRPPAGQRARNIEDGEQKCEHPRNWYLGEYANGIRHGLGTYHFSDGREYSGSWMNGQQCGEGQYKTYLGVTRRGLWDQGKRHPREWTDGLGSHAVPEDA